MTELKVLTAHDFNRKVFTIAELKNLLNQFDDSDKVEFLLCADATWSGVEGDLSVDVNNETVLRVDL